MEFTGKVIWMGEKRQGTSSAGKAWAAQEYAVQDAMQQYPRTVCFNVLGEEKIKEFNIRLGEELKVYFDINARDTTEGISTTSAHGKWSVLTLHRQCNRLRNSRHLSIRSHSSKPSSSKLRHSSRNRRTTASLSEERNR